MPAPSNNSLIDRVDLADRPVGLIPRGRVFDEHAAFRVVHVFIFDRRGRLAVQRLGRRHGRHPLQLGSSVAGYLHAGESYLEAAERRLREEVAVEAPLEKFGALRMPDEGSIKFITLYTTVAESPTVSEPGHVDSIEFRELADLDQQLLERPEDFTETFRRVYQFYRVVNPVMDE